MRRSGIGRALLAGFGATAVMTSMMYAGPAMGMPKMDVAGMLGSMLGGWWMGMFMHFVNGAVIFPLIYVFLLYAFLPGPPWLRGALWGLALWFLSQALVMPMMGMGFFSTDTLAPAMTVLGSLMGHAVYGALLGAVADGAAACAVGRCPQPLRKAG